MKGKIVLLTKNFPPTICGVGDYTFELYTRLRAKGYDVKVLTEKRSAVIDRLQGSVHKADVFPVLDTLSTRSLFTILRTLKNIGASVVIIQYVPNSFSRVTLPFFLIPLVILARAMGIKVGIYFHEVSIRLFHGGIKRFIVAFLQRFIAITLNLFANFSLTSNRLYRRYFGVFAPSIVPIPANLTGHSEVREFVARERGKVFVISSFANRCTVALIDAVSTMTKKGNEEVRLCLLGHVGESHVRFLREKIRDAEIEANVHWLLDRERGELITAIYQAELFVHLEAVNRYGEGGICSKSGVLAAAMAAGLPIVGSKGDMTDLDMFIENENVVFVDPTNAQEICEKLSSLRDDKNAVQRLALGSLQLYERNFSWDNTVECYDRELLTID